MLATCIRGERSPESVFCFLGAFGWRHVLSFREDILLHPVSGSSLAPQWLEIRVHYAVVL